MKNLNTKYKPKENIFTRQNRIRANLLVFLILGLLSLTTVIGLNAQRRQELSDDERFLLKTLRVVDSMAKKAERYEAKGEMEKAKFIAEYLQRGASIDEFEMADLNKIARDLTKEETAIEREQKKLLKSKKLTKEERSQLTPEERKALKEEKRQQLREHRQELQVLNEKRKEFRKKYLDLVYETVSPDALVRFQNFVKSKVTIRREELKDDSGNSGFASVKFQPASYKPSAASPGGGTYVEVWGLSLVFHNETTQSVGGISETWGFCSYYEGSGGGGGGEPLFLDASFGLILGGYDVPCDVISVGATLRNPNGTILDSDSLVHYDSWDLAEVYVTGSVTADGNYCIAGYHYVEYDNLEVDVNTNACVEVETSQAQPEIQKVEFQVTNPIGGPIDNNPAINGHTTSSAGKRIYSGRSAPSNGTDRTKVRINATVTPPTSGVTIHFATYDMDDPSSSTVIDPGGSNDSDNNGTVGGKKEGQLSASSATTNSSGVAFVDLTVTKQPGDNFAIVATKDSGQLSGVSVNGLDLRKGGATIPTTQTSATSPLIRTELLTVWRKLHIEVDSMGDVTNNFKDGEIYGNYTIGSGNTTLSLEVNGGPLEIDRFERGRIIIGTGTSARAFPVIDNDVTSSPVVFANTPNTVTIANTGASMNVTEGTPFKLYDDDDDFISDDGANLNGDQDENVDPPDTANISSSDTPCEDDYEADNCNSFAPAYITPTYDLGSHTNEVTFDLHKTRAELQTLVAGSDFGQRATHISPSFWTVYLLGGYQAADDEDGDPNDIRINATTYIRTQGISGQVDAINGAGAIINMEQDRPLEVAQASATNWQTRPLEQRFTVVHEIGHLFGLLHEDRDDHPTMPNAWIMEQGHNRTRAIFNDKQINKIRSIDRP